MSEDVKEQMINEMKASAMFSLQVDETTDVASCAGFVRYIHLRDVKEEFLFCSELEATTRSADIMKKIETFLIQQSCNGKIFAEFVLMELQLCWVGIQAFRKRLKNLLLKQKVRIVLFTDMRLPSKLYQPLCKMY